MDIFIKFLSWDFISTIIEQTFNALTLEKMHPLNNGDNLCYIGFWILKVTVSGFSWNDYWSMQNFDEKTNFRPFNLSPLMSKHRFDTITQEVHFTSKTSPNFINQIWVSKMIDEWNKNMASVFVPCRICCLDKIMFIWNSIFTCPG